MNGQPPESKPRRFPLSLDKVAARPSGASGASGTVATPGSSVAGTRTVLRPQAPLHHAAQDRLRQAVPQGVGLDSVHVRRRMVDRLVADGISHPAVLQAMATVPRHLFVDTALVNQAYEDTSLPIGLNQTISKPSVVSSMIQLLCQRPGVPQDVPAELSLGVCLEIGTGCGYQAAVLACLARRVVSIERLKDLHHKARHHLDLLRQQDRSTRDVRLIYGDGMLGHAPGAPYDTIIAAAGGESLPEAWLNQLAPGGRLVAPVADGQGRNQTLTVVDRLPDGSLVHSRYGAVHFVPLKSGIF
jgi:protein-L-isoaspartate(D-aspartate) O-methyltransferase